MTRALLVYYDAWCPICTTARRRIEQLDWLGQISFASIRAPGVAAELGVPYDRLEQRMHVRVLRTGRVLDGIDAVGAIAARVPLLMPLWPGVKLSSLMGFGQRLYDWIASRRTIVPVGACEEGACQIHGHQP